MVFFFRVFQHRQTAAAFILSCDALLDFMREIKTEFSSVFMGMDNYSVEFFQQIKFCRVHNIPNRFITYKDQYKCESKINGGN